MTFHPKPQPGIQLNHKHPMAEGLIGCWMMNESSGDVVFDSSPERHNGANSGADWIPLGLEFDGADKIQLSHPIANNLDAFTISARFNGAAGGIVYAEGYNGDANWALFMGIDPNPPYSGRFFIKENATWKATTIGTTPINDGWHNVSFSQKNKSSRTIYIDGVPEDTDTDTVGDMSTLNTSNIGVLERDTFGSYFVGDIAYVHLHNRALSNSDIYQYNRDPHGMFNRSMTPITMSYVTPPVGAIMNQFQGPNIGADLFNGALL